MTPEGIGPRRVTGGPRKSTTRKPRLAHPGDALNQPDLAKVRLKPGYRLHPERPGWATDADGGLYALKEVSLDPLEEPGGDQGPARRPTSGEDRRGPVRASEVRAERRRFAWSPRVPLGAVTILAGNPGVGKSTIAVDVAARATRGELAGDLDGPADVLIASAEDHRSAVIVPRLLAAGADVERVHLAPPFTLPDDLGDLERWLRDSGAVLAILDPFVSFVAGRVNTWRDQDVRRVLSPLAALAEDVGTALVPVVHLNKATGGDLLARVGGSVGIVAAARSALLAAKDPADPDGPRVLAHAKANMGVEAPALRYRLIGATVEGGIPTSRVEWLGEAEGVEAGDLLSTMDAEERAEQQDAGEWLSSILAGGPMAAREVFKAGRAEGFTPDVLKRAKARLGVKSSKTGFGTRGEWVWSIYRYPLS